MAKRFLRLDFGGVVRGPRVTPQGFLRLDAKLGRCGVVRYTQPDGSVRRELRLPEDVFHADSIGSLEGAPLTYLHPPRSDAWVTRQTWRDYQIGFIGDTVTRLDGNIVGGVATVQDDQRVQQVLKGELRDLSPGYICRDMEFTSGVHELYGAYDAIQRGIVHNHVGLGGVGWGRQGRDVALRLDGATGDSVAVMHLDQSALGDFLRAKIAASGMTLLEVARKTGIIEPVQGDPLKFSGSTTQTWILESILDGWTPRPLDAQLDALAKVLQLDIDELIRLLPEGERKFDGHSHSTQRVQRMQTIMIKLDGLSVDVPQRDADIVRKAIDTRDAEIAALKKSNSELQAKLDGTTEKLTKAESDLAAAPARVRAEVEQRVQLETVAKRFGVKTDGADGKSLSERALKEAVVLKLKPSADLAGKDDAYVNARFDSAVEDAGAGNAPVANGGNKGLSALQRAAAGGPPVDVETRQDAGDEDDPEKIRAERLARQANAWQPKK